MPSRQETLNAYVGPGIRLTRRNAAVCSSARGRTRPPIPTHRSIPVTSTVTTMWPGSAGRSWVRTDRGYGLESTSPSSDPRAT
jgi:hypothetical protein